VASVGEVADGGTRSADGPRHVMHMTGNGARESEFRVPAGAVKLAGNLAIPVNACGLVVFAHGSGSSRFSPRNRFVADALQHSGLGTLLMDLLTNGEEHRDQLTGHLRFDIDLLAARLVDAFDWLADRTETSQLPIGCFGASTGGSAALVAAAERPGALSAVVSRGGRPDLAGAALPKVTAPTLLLVGSLDQVVIELNQRAFDELRCEKRLELVSGATHLFEEPGTLEQVARLASDWFIRHLVP
jgi:putative phosphoribosyl transferase